MNDKKQALELLKLLSALESWSFSSKTALPDYLLDLLNCSIDELTEDVLK